MKLKREEEEEEENVEVSKMVLVLTFRSYEKYSKNCENNAGKNDHFHF